MAESSYTASSADGQTERPKSEVFNEKFDKMFKLASTSLTRAKQVRQDNKCAVYCFSLCCTKTRICLCFYSFTSCTVSHELRLYRLYALYASL